MGTEISLAVVAPNPFRGSLECPEAFKKFRRDIAVKTEQVSSRAVFFFYDRDCRRGSGDSAAVHGHDSQLKRPEFRCRQLPGTGLYDD